MRKDGIGFKMEGENTNAKAKLFVKCKSTIMIEVQGDSEAGEVEKGGGGTERTEERKRGG